MVGAGQDKTVEIVRGEELLVGGDLGGVADRRVEHHAVAGHRCRVGEAVQEAVEHRAVDAVAGRLDAHRDELGPPGAHLAGGLVDPVAEGRDRLAHPFPGLGADDLGRVDHVRDGLAGDPGPLGDRGDRDLLHRNSFCRG